MKKITIIGTGYVGLVSGAGVILDTRNILSIEKLNEYGFIFDNVGRKSVL